MKEANGADRRSLPISKQMVWQAYRKVKANQGSAGIDGKSMEQFEESLSNNLYKLWNRMASGSYCVGSPISTCNRRSIHS